MRYLLLLTLTFVLIAPLTGCQALQSLGQSNEYIAQTPKNRIAQGYLLIKEVKDIAVALYDDGNGPLTRDDLKDLNRDYLKPAETALRIAEGRLPDDSESLNTAFEILDTILRDLQLQKRQFDEQPDEPETDIWSET